MSKYHNRKIEADGYVFDSLAEHRRYCELKLLQAADEISNLEVHRRFPLEVNRTPVTVYVADFTYRSGSHLVIEDVKGVRTTVYLLKKKLMRAIHGYEITEVEA